MRNPDEPSRRGRQKSAAASSPVTGGSIHRLGEVDTCVAVGQVSGIHADRSWPAGMENIFPPRGDQIAPARPISAAGVRGQYQPYVAFQPDLVPLPRGPSHAGDSPGSWKFRTVPGAHRSRSPRTKTPTGVHVKIPSTIAVPSYVHSRASQSSTKSTGAMGRGYEERGHVLHGIRNEVRSNPARPARIGGDGTHGGKPRLRASCTMTGAHARHAPAGYPVLTPRHRPFGRPTVVARPTLQAGHHVGPRTCAGAA